MDAEVLVLYSARPSTQGINASKNAVGPRCRWRSAYGLAAQVGEGRSQGCRKHGENMGPHLRAAGSSSSRPHRVRSEKAISASAPAIQGRNPKVVPGPFGPIKVF